RMLENSRLYAANFGSHYGYNVFTNIDDYSIQFHHAIDATLYEGYNDFGSGESTADYFEGTMNFYVPPSFGAYLSAHSNAWDGSTSSPSASTYDLYHEFSSQNITVLNSGGATAG